MARPWWLGFAKNGADPCAEPKNRRVEPDLIDSREYQSRLLVVERELSQCIEVTAKHVL